MDYSLLERVQNQRRARHQRQGNVNNFEGRSIGLHRSQHLPTRASGQQHAAPLQTHHSPRFRQRWPNLAHLQPASQHGGQPAVPVRSHESLTAIRQSLHIVQVRTNQRQSSRRLPATPGRHDFTDEPRNFDDTEAGMSAPRPRGRPSAISKSKRLKKMVIGQTVISKPPLQLVMKEC